MSTRALALVGSLLLGGCVWSFPEPAARWPRPALGTPVWDGAVLRSATYDAAVSSGDVFVAVLQGVGRDEALRPATEPTLRIFATSTRGGAARELPASPLPALPTRLWPASGGVIAAQGTRAVRFDGAAWVELPALPFITTDFMRGLEGGVVLLRQGTALRVLTGSGWQPLDVAAVPQQVTSAVFGPASSGEVRVIFTHGADGLCTSAFSLPQLALTAAPSCLANQSELLGGEVANGTRDDFHAWSPGLVDLQLWHFAGGAWTRGSAVRGNRLRWTPDAPFAVASIDVTGSLAIQNLTRVVGGRATEALFVQSWELLGCDGAPNVCARQVGFVHELVDTDGSAALFLFENIVDARRSLYLERLPLPHRDGGACTPTCGVGQLCVRGSGIANLCVADPSI